MKILAVFLLAVLGWSLTEGRNVSICELKNELKNATASWTVPKRLNVDNVLAKIVCYANMVSNLNTTAENGLGNKGDHSEEDKDDSGGRSLPSTPPAQNCTLYGIFQLSSCQVCNNSVTPTTNICRIPCSDLLDDDIKNDISCLLTFSSSHGDRDSLWQQLKKLQETLLKNMEYKCKDLSAYNCI